MDLALVVDPDPIARVRFTKALRDTHEIVEVNSPDIALLLVSRIRFTVVFIGIAGEAGLGLLRSLRDLDPQVGLVLVRDGGFTLSQVQQILRIGAHVTKRGAGTGMLRDITNQAILNEDAPNRDVVPAPPPPPPRVRLETNDALAQPLLDQLRQQSESQLVIYTDYLGNLVLQSGDASAYDISAIASLVASSFVNSVELGQMIDEPETLQLSVHEGQASDMYSVNCGNQRLLSLLINKTQSQLKLGYIWMLMKRVALQLMKLTETKDQAQTNQVSDHLSTSLNAEFDRLFGSELTN